MNALMKTVNLKECPRLSLWIEDREGLLCNYMKDIQRVLPKLLAVQANLAGGDETSDDYMAVAHAAQVLGCIANDMDAIQKELFTP